jgi:hypothetical protein
MPCVLASTSGKMTMWSSASDVIVGSSCEYANSAQGGLSSPAATSPYITSKRYCAVSSDLYGLGLACGRCYRLTFDGTDTTESTGCASAGSSIIQVVDSGSTHEFDCQETVFEEITGCDTGVMGITYEEVECEDVGSPTATVLDGDNAWYNKMIFSGLSRGVSAASIKIGGDDTIQMTRNSGATWYASTPGTSGDVTVTFSLTLENDETVQLADCFNSWPQATSSSCTVSSSSSDDSSSDDSSSGDSSSDDSSSDDSSSDDSSSDDSSSDDANCIQVAHWGKCAGGGMTNRCCAEGLQCYKFSEWYSQCLTSCPSGWECSGDRRRNLRGAFRK